MNDDVACCSLQSRMRNNNVKGPSSKNIRIHFARGVCRGGKGDKGSSFWSSSNARKRMKFHHMCVSACVRECVCVRQCMPKVFTRRPWVSEQ